jgi:hypothetical protein
VTPIRIATTICTPEAGDPESLRRLAERGRRLETRVLKGGLNEETGTAGDREFPPRPGAGKPAPRTMQPGFADLIARLPPGERGPDDADTE